MVEDLPLNKKPTYEELEQTVKEQAKKIVKLEQLGQAALKAQKYAENIVNTVRYSLLVLDRDLRVITANRSFYQIFKVTPEATEGRLLYDIGNRQWDNPELRSLLGEILLKNTTIEAFEVEHDFETIGRKAMMLNARRLYGDTKTQMILLAIEDVTEKKQAEKKIKDYYKDLERNVEKRTRELKRALYDAEEARDKIDGILKSVGGGLIVTDIYNRVVLMNRSAEDLFGVRLSEVINRPINFAIKDETLRNIIKKTLDKKEEGNQFDFELTGENKKYPRIMRIRTSVVKDKTGKQTGIVSIIFDVTKDRELDRMKTEFISIAAHELRTPLTSIQGFSEILLRRDDIKEEEKKKFLSYINKQSVNLANIVNIMLDISRIESGRGLLLDKAPQDINQIIIETVGYFQLFSKKHQFDTILPEGPLELMMDKEKVRQVIENILSNAIKYSPEGGLIRVTVELSGDYCQISTEDQGIGIAPDQIEKIFEKFYRVDASATAVNGIGLGMSIVKNIVESHGGKVWAESEQGKGTVIRFTIPRT